MEKARKRPTGADQNKNTGPAAREGKRGTAWRDVSLTAPLIGRVFQERGGGAAETKQEGDQRNRKKPIVGKKRSLGGGSLFSIMRNASGERKTTCVEENVRGDEGDRFLRGNCLCEVLSPREASPPKGLLRREKP